MSDCQSVCWPHSWYRMSSHRLQKPVLGHSSNISDQNGVERQSTLDSSEDLFHLKRYQTFLSSYHHCLMSDKLLPCGDRVRLRRKAPQDLLEKLPIRFYPYLMKVIHYLFYTKFLLHQHFCREMFQGLLPYGQRHFCDVANSQDRVRLDWLDQ